MEIKSLVKKIFEYSVMVVLIVIFIFGVISLTREIIPQTKKEKIGSIMLPSTTNVVARNGNIVTRATASPIEQAEMIQAYRDLGSAPNGAKTAGFQQIARGAIFRCPNGQPGLLMKAVKDKKGGVAAQWKCNNR